MSEVATPTPVLAAEKVQKSISTTLVDGRGNSLVFTGNVMKDGSVKSFVTYVQRDAEGKVKDSQRGATTSHVDITAARAALDKTVSAQVKAGWTRRTGGGFKQKPDAFTLSTLPAPKK